MNSASPPLQATSSRPGRKPKKSLDDGVEPGQKPKKVNSEIRKQQNRIASRNYREKRKRKLQYLQQLLKDGPSEQDDATSTESAHDARTRSISSEYIAQDPLLNTMNYPSSPNFNDTLLSTTGNANEAVLATTSSYNSPYLAPAQPFQGVQSSWNAPIYEAPQPTLPEWSVPHWAANAGFSSHVVPSTHENFQFAPPHTQPMFDPLPTTLQLSQPQETVPSSDLFIVGSWGACRSSPRQSQGMSSCMNGQQPYIPKRSVYI